MQNTLMSYCHSYVAQKKIHVGTQRYIIIQNRQIISSVLFWLRYTVLETCIGQHCFLTSVWGELSLAQGLVSQSFHHAEKGRCYSLIPAARV